jgi:Ala-tRNA(Pro) deacylase
MSRVLDYLQGRGVVFTVIPQSAPSDDVRANAPDHLVVRTVVAIVNDSPALLLIPGGRALDPELVAEALGDPTARLATDRELEVRFPDYEPGALPPLSMLLLAPMYVDPVVAEREEIVFAAGRSDVAVKMSTSDLIGNDPVVLAPLTSRDARAES